MNFWSTFFLVFISTVINVVSCEPYRLPKHVKPIRYYLTIEPHPYSTLYTGSVLIELQILKSARNITLHQKMLKIYQSNVTVVNSKGEDLKVRATSSDYIEERFTIHLKNRLIKGENYTLKIGKFKGKFGDSEGFFRAFYRVGKSPRRLAATHFEPTGARTAFPCFDEPSFKAKFIVSLIRTAEYTSVSNENLDKTENLGDGRFKDTFKETPLMSTFLLAFAVTDFKYSEKLERHRILARPESIDQEEYKYSLEIANRTLISLEEYTGIAYVIEKMDQIAIPAGYFNNLAMENWGLVTFREEVLMHSNKSLAEDYQQSACIIAHEFSHQWFGNLVTPTWWSYIWISESFASYFQYYMANIIQPTMRLDDQFVIEMVQPSFRAEEVFPGPLNTKIKYLGQYPPYHIIYEKGSSIVRMMEHFLTHNVFRKGLQIYLKKNKFKNTKPSHLYAAFQRAVNKARINNNFDNRTIKEIMNTWDSSSGFPIITVKRDYKTGSLTLEQKPGIKNLVDITNTKWIIPINYAFSAGKPDFSKTTADYWLVEQSATINHDFPTDGWLIVNKQQTGYYRVNYDLENWERIIQTLKSDDFKSIHVLNRAQLIDDAFSFAKKSELPWDIPLRLGEYIVRERDYIPLSAFYYALRETVYVFDSSFSEYYPKEKFKFFGYYTLINNISLKNPNEFEVYKQYITTTLAGVKDTLGFEEKPDDTHIDKLHRRKLLKFAKYFKTK